MCHIEYSLRLLILKKTLGYTVLMGVPHKVQPTFANIYHTGDKVLPVYTALVGVPHRVQPTFTDIKQNTG